MHGFGEFLLHLFTITAGLLIAVQIESCVEWRLAWPRFSGLIFLASSRSMI